MSEFDNIVTEVEKESTQPPIKDRFPIVLASSFVKMEFPTSSWIIEKLIKKGGISFIIGEPGTGKTIASLSIVKAISTSTPWLDKFPAMKAKVLVLDKENSPADIQSLYKTLGINNDNVYNLFTEEDYEFITDKGKITEVGTYLQTFIKEKNIDVVIMDSAIDFLKGDENSSIVVATNINKWREICGDASILAIHHEGKQDPRNKKKAADRSRGSSVWVSSAQSIISLSVMSQESPEKLIVEHTKVRGAKKMRPFQIEMIIRPDPFHPNETVVDGYKYIREIEAVKLTEDKTKEAIIDFLEKHLDTVFTSQEIFDEIGSDEIKQRNIGMALPKLANDGDIQKLSGYGAKGNAYGYKMCVSNVLESAEKKGGF